MEVESRLQEDLSILLDMYPELQIDVDLENVNKASKIQGKLPFNVSLPQDLKVKHGDQELVFKELTSNTLNFEINQDEYPNLRRAISLEIQSPWMTVEDRTKLLQAIHHEFDDMTDPNSEIYDEYAPVMMLVFGYLTDDSSQTLIEGQERICQTQDEFESFVQMFHKIEFNEMASQNFNCSICMETKKGDKMIKLPCHHALCLDCTKSYYTAMIEQASIDRVRCVECEYNPADLEKFNNYKDIKRALFTPSIPFETFHGVLAPQICKKYQKLFHEQAANKLSKYCTYSCVTCTRCGYWCVKENLDEPMIQCPNCEFTFCFDCLHSWHGYNNICGKKVSIPKDVVELYVNSLELTGLEDRKMALEAKYGKRIMEMEADAYVSDKMLDEAVNAEGSNLQRCPRCRIVVQRSEGCNKMKCTVCSTPFCYICGEMFYIDDPYEHFRNPLSECYARLFEGMPGTDS
ncbi:hypothetical protein ZYGR_0H04510 [Zygosaccharomyces rouxii]|uniref:RBR-type E3 ubiquitin transferase n=2 Tax=Zygosaccharomyces rouxii TaxID=4956 RepID=C5DS72_ZYGRC|nr:uncharacterized protein ZYRO0B14388g [Zygosaccharomyces rouxii]KAH9199838.1 hypothetical protein LQ764DRAFT_234456 [Zygosaccharomyces rouxii]GAV47605.1 hypothetical protein ZYGR_0H04510 [Zygosaccharomyces rouxii]CAR26633.1 ZYRO0B14388p [Zygosaccharomyces rouxii]